MERNSFDRIVWWAIIVVFGVSSLALLGWIFDISSLKSVKADWIPMKIVTVSSLWSCAAALFLAHSRGSLRWGQRFCLWLGALVCLVGLLSCLPYVGLLYFGKEMDWVFKPLLRWIFSPAQRMAPLSALLFMGCGLAFILLSLSTPRADAVSHALMLLVAIMSYTVLVGYLFQGATLITWMNIPVAFNTAIAFLALSIGIFCARPGTWFMRVFSSRGVGGRIARRLLPVLLTVSLLIGWVLFTAVQSGFLNLEKADTLVVTANAVVMLTVIWFAARSTNITDERRQGAEEALRKAHSELELRVEERTAELSQANEVLEEKAALLDLAHDAITVLDMSGKIIYWNRGAEMIYGWSAEEALGQDIRPFLKTRFPKPWEEIEKELLERTEWGGETSHVDRRGNTILELSRMVLHRDHEGNPVKILEISRDITDLKRAEEKLLEYMRNLERTNQELQEFTYVASHDLQEPLRKIQTFSSLIQMRGCDVIEGANLEHIKRMQNAANRMQYLILGLLDYSKISIAPGTFSIMSLKSIMADVGIKLRDQIRESGARLEIGDLPLIEAKRDLMVQLFTHLVSNAIKYRGERKPQIRIYGEAADKTCTIYVEDNGIGFDEQYLDKIFRPFQRLHRQGEYEGIGIGLTIARKIAEHHDGEITARSSPGEGSTFIIKLPLGRCKGRDDEPERRAA